jgi:hypothetical protein
MELTPNEKMGKFKTPPNPSSKLKGIRGVNNIVASVNSMTPMINPS